MDYKQHLSTSIDNYITLSLQELESNFLDVIYLYEQSILTFVSLLKEPDLQEYIDESNTYLALACDKEALEFSKAHEKPWPSIEHLFANDDDYQKCISDIVRYISVEITNVEEYAEVRDISTLSSFSSNCAYILKDLHFCFRIKIWTFHVAGILLELNFISAEIVHFLAHLIY